jgi:hypothetical protein
MNAAAIRLAGAGRAYQAVAQSTAIAIQDATDYLHNVSTIAATSIGVAMAQIAASQGAKGTQLLSNAQGLIAKAAQDFSTISTNAITVATNYPQSFG